MKHFLTGKARSLEDALAAMEAAFKHLGIEPVVKNWLNPAPFIWSVHVHDARCPALFSNGKGISKEAALASAYGEFLERFLTGYHLADYTLPTTLPWLYGPDEVVMSPEDAWAGIPQPLREVWDPDGLLSPEMHLPELGICSPSVHCIPMQAANGNETIQVPWNLLVNLYASNGLSAGNTCLEARIQGLSEIFERWVRNRILDENLCLPEVPESVLAANERVVEARTALDQAGISLSVRDASLESGYPVIVIILYAREQRRAFVSFGAHPIFDVALERTLTEAFQGRCLGDYTDWKAPSDDLDWVQSAENRELHFIDASGQFHWHFFSTNADFTFSPWGLAPSADFAQQWDYLLEKVDAAGHAAYVQDIPFGAFHACRIIVPGMSEVLPSVELIDNNHNAGCALRAHLMAYDARDRWAWELLDLLDAWGWADHASVTSVAGLIAAPTSPWHGTKLLELRIRALCQLQQHDELISRADSIEYLLAGSPRLNTLLALRHLAHGEDEGEKQALMNLYGEEAVSTAQQWLAGDAWADLPLAEALLDDPWYRGFESLLQARVAAMGASTHGAEDCGGQDMA